MSTLLQLLNPLIIKVSVKQKSQFSNNGLFQVDSFIEELDARIDDAEEQIARVNVIDANLFFRQMYDRTAARE